MENGIKHALSLDAIRSLLAAHDEGMNPEKVCYYTDIRALAEKVSGSKCWSQGEVFVFCESEERFVVMKQIAPSSCEMLTITNKGFQDVLTAYRYQLDDLVTALLGYMDGSQGRMGKETGR